jgi:DNA-binding NtrC family response regulator/tetratricopeptide (TPR) repeat protein
MAYSQPLPAAHPLDRLVGRSPAIYALRGQIRHLATFDGLGQPHVPTVLLCGETGTGKGLVARIIHDSGPRAHGPFIEINCAAIPETLLEAELYGVAAGAFTDAKRAKPGLFEAASGGTFFLDEIDALPLVLQGKVLTAIEAKRVRRLGAVTERAVDVKLIAATQADLSKCVRERRFRSDLYQRLAVILLDLPPLRERGEDVIVLAAAILQQYAEAYRLSPRRLSVAAEGWLRAYSWPGNVRELSHLLERVMLLSVETIIDPATLERLCLPQLPSEAGVGPTRDRRADEDDAARMTQALRSAEGNVARAARLLGLSRKAMRYRMRKYGISRPPAHRQPQALSCPSRPGTREVRSLVMGESQGGGDEAAAFSPTLISAPSWERKPVAVLALELSWPVPAEGESPRYEPWTVVSRWEQALIAKLQGFGGVVLQRSPSLLLVVFGIPQTPEQLPQRAVQASLALRQLVAQGAAREPCPALRLVVHWGEVLVDAQARDPTTQLCALGETLAWPVRLLGHAAPGEILLSPAMGPLVEGWCEVQAREVSLQGVPPGRIGVSTVVGNRPSWAQRERPRRRPLSPLVDRDHELETLRAQLRRVQGGQGQVVSVMGEPGIGKSRLCDEFVRGALEQPWLILESHGTAYSQAIPYFPIIDLLKGYFHIDDRDDRATIRDRVRTHLSRLDDALTPTLPAFLTLLEVPVEDPQWQALEAPQRRQYTLDALKRVLVHESQVQPVLLVVEDLHWIDPETQACLDTLMDSLPTARLLLLVNYRPEYRHGWGSKTYYTQLRLDALPPKSAEELLQGLLGDDPSLTALKQLLVERTEGNPFFLEESVRTLIETKVLVGAPGSYRLAQGPPTIQVPATVQAVLAARMDRLPSEEKQLLQTAAVIGTKVPFPLLQAIAGVPKEGLRTGLAHLQAAEFLYETSLFPELAYTFKHALTQEVAYGSLPQDRRRALHAQIVSAIEALAAERLAEQVERLAHHALRGEVWDKAVTYCQQAGAKAYDRAAFREAAVSFELALQALAHVCGDGDTSLLAIDLRLVLGGALRILGEYERCLALLGEAEALARALDDQARLGRVLAGMTGVLRVMGDHDGALVAGQQALAVAVARGDRALQVQASYDLGGAYQAIGDFGRAAELLRRNVEATDWASGTPGTNLRIVSLAWLALTLSNLGAFAEGRHHGEEALRLATLDGRGATPIVAHGCLGLLYLAQGDLEHAVLVLEQSLALCRASGNLDWLRRTVAGLGYAYALQGRLAEGRALVEEAISESLQTGARQNQGRWVAWLSEVCRLAGHREAAWQHARQALALARQRKERANEAHALFQLGVVHAHADPLDAAQAEAHYRQGLALADELGMRPLVAHCHLGLGTLYARMDHHDQARAELSTAIALYRTMEMSLWLPRAEATLAQVGGSAGLSARLNSSTR